MLPLVVWILHIFRGFESITRMHGPQGIIECFRIGQVAIYMTAHLQTISKVPDRITYIAYMQGKCVPGHCTANSQGARLTCKLMIICH